MARLDPSAAACRGRRPHRRRRSRARAGRACRPRAANGRAGDCARRSTRISSRAHRRRRGRAGRRAFRRAAQRGRAALPLSSSSTGARRWCSSAGRRGWSRSRSTSRRCTRRRRSLIGRHDFSTFRDAQCQANSPLRTLDYFRRRAREGETIRFDVGARSFLHRQVRSMVGSLVEVGLGKWSAADFRAAFEAADRSRCGPVAPPDGLYLMRVDYPAK